jgi:hypothetical protein
MLVAMTCEILEGQEAEIVRIELPQGKYDRCRLHA